MKLSDLKAGDIVCLDDGFTCIGAGEVTVHGNDNGLYFECECGHHYLDGQLDWEDHETLIGILPAGSASK